MLRRKRDFVRDIIAALPFSSIALLFTGGYKAINSVKSFKTLNFILTGELYHHEMLWNAKNQNWRSLKNYCGQLK